MHSDHLVGRRRLPLQERVRLCGGSMRRSALSTRSCAESEAFQSFDLARAKATGPSADQPCRSLKGSEHIIPPDKLRAVNVRPPRGIGVPIIPWSTTSTIAKELLVAQESQCHLLIVFGGSPRRGGSLRYCPSATLVVSMLPAPTEWSTIRAMPKAHADGRVAREAHLKAGGKHARYSSCARWRHSEDLEARRVESR